VDLTDATSAQLQFQLLFNTEPSYDNVIVEAHTPGQDNWTTLPDLNGHSQNDPPAECQPNGFLLNQHPFLRHYLGGPGCTGPGTSGVWNSFTGSSGGWQQVAVDLSRFLGGEVELAISYVTDPVTGGVGAFVDDTRLVIDGAETGADGFEAAASEWTPGGPPAGSPPNSGNWRIGEQEASFFAGTSTEDTLLLGFGLEQLETPGQRADILERALDGLID
jgi:hypothetical protein